MKPFCIRDWQLIDDSTGPRVVIPIPRLWPFALFLGLWLYGWVAGEISALSALIRFLRGANPLGQAPFALFLMLWLAAWTVGGISALGLLLLSLCGREILSLNDGHLLVRYEAFGVGWTRRFALAALSGLRVERAVPTDRAAQAGDAPLAFLAFTHHGKLRLMALGLRADRAEELRAVLGSRFSLPTDMV